MGLLTKLGLAPTPAMLANAGGGSAKTHDAPPKAPGQAAPAKAAPAKSPEMASLVARFQEVMGRIKALEALKAPQAGALKKATIAAGNLSTSPKGIVSANAALDKVEAQIVDAKLKLADTRPAEAAPADGKKLAAEARKRLKAIEARGRKALAADPRNPNAGWLTEAVGDSEERIVDLEQRGTQREIDSVRKQLDWLEENIVGFEADAAKEKAEEEGSAEGKKQAEDSPALKKAKAHFKHVMVEVKKLADAKIPQAAALKKAAIDAGNLATSPKGIERSMRALDMVLSDAIQAKADAVKAKADAAKAEAEAAKAAAETFDITVGGKKLAGVRREEAMQALRQEVGRLSAQLEGGWAFHVDQMNLPNEVPFQAWLTTGVDAVKSFFKGQDAAKIPDLNIWDPVRDMMNEVKKAERKGDVKAIAALLPKIATAIPKARAKVGKYQEQMEGSAQTGVDAGRFVEDTAASAIGTIEEARSGGSKANKVLAQASAQALFQSVEQLTEWVIGTRQHADPSLVAQKFGEEAIGAIFKELIAGKLKGLFKSAFGSYLDKGISDAALKAMGLSRDAFMTAAQKYFAEFAAKQGAGLIKSAIGKLIHGKLPSSPEAMVDAIAADLMKGSSKQLIVDGIKEITKAAVVSTVSK